jgi:ATP-dependent DNA helicase RecG
MEENKNIDKKSLKFLKGKQTDWDELAKDCVCFANALGGFVLIGIEDKEKLPLENQKISDRTLPDIIQKNIAHRTVNVGIAVTIETADNKAEYIQVQVFRSAQTIASTTDGKYYVRVHDECKPVPPDEMARLAADKNAFVWEEQTTKRIPATQYDETKRRTFLNDIRNSQRVSRFIKEMSDEEMLDFLEELIYKDLTAYPNSGFGEIHQRIGKEINQYKVKRMLKNMIDKQILETIGKTGGMKYQLKQNLQENG